MNLLPFLRCTRVLLCAFMLFSLSVAAGKNMPATAPGSTTAPITIWFGYYHKAELQAYKALAQSAKTHFNTTPLTFKYVPAHQVAQSLLKQRPANQNILALVPRHSLPALQAALVLNPLYTGHVSTAVSIYWQLFAVWRTSTLFSPRTVPPPYYEWLVLTEGLYCQAGAFVSANGQNSMHSKRFVEGLYLVRTLHNAFLDSTKAASPMHSALCSGWVSMGPALTIQRQILAYLNAQMQHPAFACQFDQGPTGLYWQPVQKGGTAMPLFVPALLPSQADALNALLSNALLQRLAGCLWEQLVVPSAIPLLVARQSRDAFFKPD